jgi:hypothetical protein
MTTTQITKAQANAIRRNAHSIAYSAANGTRFVLSSLSRRGDFERLVAAGVVTKVNGDWNVTLKATAIVASI